MIDLLLRILSPLRILLCFAFFFHGISCFAQCPEDIKLTVLNDKITIDNFNDAFAGVTHYGTTSVLIESDNPGCVWDLYADATLIPVQIFSTQGVDLSLNNIFIRAINNCGTPDQVAYPFGPVTPPNDRITQTFNNNLVTGPRFYIIGTDVQDGLTASDQGACIATDINGQGNYLQNSSTHRFRIDIRVNPDLVAPVTNPGIYNLVLQFYAEDDDPLGVGSPPSVTYNLTIEILPVLQLTVNTPSMLNFSFTTIPNYLGGITQFGSTSLYVSSTVEWDLVAVGTSSQYENTGNAFWDVMAEYTSAGNNQLPLNVLELHQTPANPTGTPDYSAAFSNPPTGNNDIMVGRQNGTNLDIDPVLSPILRSIAGNFGATGAGNAMMPGSYMQITGGAYNAGDFKYQIDYRLLPMIPTTFNQAILPLKPGIYNMEVRYIIMEDQ